MARVRRRPEKLPRSHNSRAIQHTHVGGVYLLGTHYLAPGFTRQLTPLISFQRTNLVLIYPTPSAFIAPQVAYNIAEDIHLSVGGFVSVGKRPKNGEAPDISIGVWQLSESFLFLVSGLFLSWRFG